MKVYYNLHQHSCLSPCGADDCTPANVIHMCALCGYEVVALTDHNSAANCEAAAAVAQEVGLLLVPGLELTTQEEVHVVCLFDSLDGAQAFSAVVYERLPDVGNDTSIFGRQVIADAHDNEVGEITKMLNNATDIGIYDVVSLVRKYGGLAFPAHIDRPSFSLLANLGFFDEAMGFTLAEVSRYAPADFVSPLPFVNGVDAHDLSAIPDAVWQLEIAEKTPKGVIDALLAL